MTSRLSQRTSSILAAAAIVVLVAFIVFLWTGVQYGIFTKNKKPKMQTSVTDENNTMFLSVGSKSYEWEPLHGNTGQNDAAGSERSLGTTKVFLPPEKIGNGKDVAYVKPIKTSPLPLHMHDIIYDQSRYGHHEEPPTLRHHSGHFRHKMSTLWDPHPEYNITAFGETLHIILTHDSKFVSPNLHVGQVWNNYIQKLKPNFQRDGCFYSGRVDGDPQSLVAVSLCNGMTGTIRTKNTTYFIEPVEQFHNFSLKPILHAIRRVQLATEKELNNHGEEKRPCGAIKGSENDVSSLFHQVKVEHNVENSTEFVAEAAPSQRQKRDLWRQPPRRNHYQLHYNRNRYVRRRHSYYARSNATIADVESFYPEDPYLYYSEPSQQLLNDPDYMQEYYIEVMVFADRSMMETHKTDENIEHYILTLMSDVARLYKDPSIGNPITISVVGIDILKEVDFMKKTGSEERVHEMEILENFCKWQKSLNYKFKYDVALLLTRDEICPHPDKEADCSTLGLAPVGAMCNPLRSCAIIKDRGLSTSFTIAHEIGHLLDMPHDDVDECIQIHNGQSISNVMTKMIHAESNLWLWSNCSKYFLTEFLHSPYSHCLRDKPNTDFIVDHLIDKQFPGENYTDEKQCELSFSAGWKVCSIKEVDCKELWCSLGTNQGCHSRRHPMADGTPCGARSWCHKGECISLDKNVLTPVTGGWGPFKEWGACSMTCGGGIRSSWRECDNPRPDHGGSYCVGPPIRYESCNTQPCPPPANGVAVTDSREEQCAKYNGDNRGLHNVPHNVTWVPKYGGIPRDEQCTLFCRVEHTNYYYPFERKVRDGTKCELGGFNICVNGVCEQGGCDNKLGSTLILDPAIPIPLWEDKVPKIDSCGICGGDDSQCVTVSGAMNESLSYGYHHVVRIPRGSMNLEITQTSHLREQVGSGGDLNHLALYDPNNGKYILNGNYMISPNTKVFHYAGLTIEYSGSHTIVEKINSSRSKALQSDVNVQIFANGRSQPLDIEYKYTVLRDTIHEYAWQFVEPWTICSRACGGIRIKRPSCIHLGTRSQVTASNCAVFRQEPTMMQENCNTHCSLSWVAVSKSECSSYCGNGTRQIRYECIKTDLSGGDRTAVEQRACADIPMPPENETCSGPCERTHWEYGDWEPCSVTCGRYGHQSRSATCVDEGGNYVEDLYCASQEKIETKSCNNQPCAEWDYNSDWTPCSSTCGPGFQRRPYYCRIESYVVPEERCDPATKLSDKRFCNIRPCVEWMATDWKPCSVSCGIGSQERELYCKNSHNDQLVDMSMCNDFPKPTFVRQCPIIACPWTTAAASTTTQVSNEDYQDNAILPYGTEWRTGSWSECTKTCGRGKRFRPVYCIDESGNNMPGRCNDDLKPTAEVYCNKEPCPTWNYGGWSKCDSNCYQNRQIRCQDRHGTSLADSKCPAESRPVHAKQCPKEMCQIGGRTSYNNGVAKGGNKVGDVPSRHPRKYRWKPTNWGPCSKTCGKGTRQRHIYCVDGNNNKISDQYCNHLRRPVKTVKYCFKTACRGYVWIEGEWSQCSEECGDGVQVRDVKCHKVNNYGFTEPIPFPHERQSVRGIRSQYCDNNSKPIDSRRCKKKNCDDNYFWKEGPWQKCTHECGRKGRQKRNLYCYDRKGEKRMKHLCPKEFKPVRNRKCNQKPCGYVSCKDIKIRTRNRVDTEYQMSVHGRNVTIFCRAMHTDNPTEYLTLRSGPLENYAEMYDKRLAYADSCPYDGRRNENCDLCMSEKNPSAGLTQFQRVRINITTLQIATDDFTFSRQIGHGHRIKFGMAGDCYSTSMKCPQGRFSINLEHTGFRVSARTRWAKMGHYSSSTINRKDSARITGRCGGSCGHCVPEEDIGLLLEVT